jgi:hypothetical protein
VVSGQSLVAELVANVAIEEGSLGCGLEDSQTSKILCCCESDDSAILKANGRAGVIQLVECQLPKLDVAGSSPVSRSMFSMG